MSNFSMEDHISMFSGATIDDAVDTITGIDPASFAWMKVVSSVSRPADLNTLRDIGNFVVRYYTNGLDTFDNIPVNISVCLMDDKLTQIIIAGADRYLRQAESQEAAFGPWHLATDVIGIPRSPVAPTDAIEGSIWLDTSNTSAPALKRYDGTAWYITTNEVYMDTDVYDKNNNKISILLGIVNALGETAGSIGLHEAPIDIAVIPKKTVYDSGIAYIISAPSVGPNPIQSLLIMKETPVLHVLPTGEWVDIIYAFGMIFIRSKAGKLLVSPTGEKWTNFSKVSANVKFIKYTGNRLFIFDQLGYGYSSFDNVIWNIEKISIPAEFVVEDVAYGNKLYLLAGHGAGIASDKYFTSSDGIVWEIQTLPTSALWAHVIYGNKIFIIFANERTTGNTINSYVSSDGIKWVKDNQSCAGKYTGYSNGEFVSMENGNTLSFFTSNTTVVAPTLTVEPFEGLVVPGSISLVDGLGFAVYLRKNDSYRIKRITVSSIFDEVGSHIADPNIHITPENEIIYDAKLNPADLATGIAAFTDTTTKYSDSAVAALGVTGASDSVTKSRDDITAHLASTEMHLTAEQKAKYDAKATSDHTHHLDGKVTIDGSNITTGEIDIERLPPELFNVVITVLSDDVRFLLTKEKAHNGTVVHVYNPDVVPILDEWYRVKDDNKLALPEGYLRFTPDESSAIGYWDTILGIPTTVEGYGVADLYTKTELSAVMATSDKTRAGYSDTELEAFFGRIMPQVESQRVSSGDLNEKVKMYDGILLPEAMKWTIGNAGVSSNLEGIIYSNNKFVSVGFGGNILTSTDTVTWTKRESGTTNMLWGITYGNNLYIAVGFGGTIVTSTDAITWTIRPTEITDNLLSIAHGANIYVAVGNAGTIATSPTGTTWTKRISNVADTLHGIVFANGLFVAVGLNGAITTSPDGITWTKRTSGVVNGLWGVAYSNGVYASVGNDGMILSSSDGFTWSRRGEASDNDLYDITSGNGVFVAVANDGVIITSTNGMTWNRRANGEKSDISAITNGNGLFVAAGGNGVIVTSPDGTNPLIYRDILSAQIDRGVLYSAIAGSTLTTAKACAVKF